MLILIFKIVSPKNVSLKSYKHLSGDQPPPPCTTFLQIALFIFRSITTELFDWSNESS